MKSFIKGLFICSFVLSLVSSCGKGYDDSALKNKIDALTTDVNTLKAQQQAMQTVIDVWKAGGYVQSIDNTVPGQHTITFYGENGKTVVIYDGAQGPQGPQGPQGAAGSGGDAFFKSVVPTEDGVTFTLANDTSFTIPFVKAFKLVIANPSAEVKAGVPVEFPYEVKNANSTTTVDVFAGGNYVAIVNEADKKIVVTPPTPAVAGSVLVWAQNAEGLFSMQKLSFYIEAETQITTNVEEYQAIPADAGDVVVNIVSNVDIKAAQPEVDWVTAVVTKADYKLTLTLAENTTGQPRETTVKILRSDNDAQVQAIKIVQTATHKTPKMTVADIKALCTSSTPVAFKGDFSGMYVNYVLSNQHIYLEDETGAIRFYLETGNTLKVGDKLSGIISGKCLKESGNGRPQISTLDWWTEGKKSVATEEEMPKPVTGTLASFKENYNNLLFRRVKLEDVVTENDVKNGDNTISDASGQFGLKLIFTPTVSVPKGSKVSFVGTFDTDGSKNFIKLFSQSDVTNVTPPSGTDPNPTVPDMTVADIKALCTSSTPAEFKGKFSGIYVNYVLGNQHIYLEDASGAIRLYLDSGNTLKVGDKISGIISGKCVKDSNGRPQLSVFDWWTNGGKKETATEEEMPKPVTGTIASLATVDYNYLLFRRVKLENVALQSAAKKGNNTISDGTGTFTVYLNFDPGTVPAGYLVSGVGTFDYNVNSTPKQFIKVFAATDITGVSAPAVQ